MDTPAGLKASTGSDSVVTVSAEGDLEELASVLQRGIEGATTSSVVDRSVLLGVKGTRGVLPAVIQVAESSGRTITDLSINEPTLETVFIKLTGRELRE